MSDESKDEGVKPNMPVTAPVAATPTTATEATHLGGLPIAGKAPEGYKGPTVTPPPASGIVQPKLSRVRLKKEAMGYHSQSGYQSPGGNSFLVTEDELRELGERVDVLGDGEEGESHIAGDPENPNKNKPVGVESQPGGQTPV